MAELRSAYLYANCKAFIKGRPLVPKSGSGKPNQDTKRAGQIVALFFVVLIFEFSRFDLD